MLTQVNVLIAPCPAHIDIAMVNKLFDLATMQDTVPASVKAHYDELNAHASDCTGCGGKYTDTKFMAANR